MGELTTSERELVALGAALGSNCVPCIEYHVPEARRSGLTDRKIDEAIRVADTVRQVPARKVLATALGLLSAAELKVPARADAERSDSPCADPAPDSGAEPPCCT